MAERSHQYRTVVATQMSNDSEEGGPTETLEMDWSHSPQAIRQHYTATSLNLEPRSEEEKRTTGNMWAMICKQLSRLRDASKEIGSRPECLVESY